MTCQDIERSDRVMGTHLLETAEEERPEILIEAREL
jgi:hypothetical protein